MIIFRKLRYKNFISTGNHFTEIRFDEFENTLVVGANGSGKSTMLDGVCFALFGKPFRKINKPQLLNSINAKECVVEVEFDTSNKSFKIIRGIKPNVFEIYQNGELLNQDAAARDYQDFLEKFILKLNYKSFTQIVLLGSASFTPFMQLSANDRRAIIEDLLDIQIFSAMNGIVKSKLSENRQGLSDSKLLIESSNEKIAMQEKFIASMKQNNEDKVTEYAKEIQNNQSSIQALYGETANLSLQVETHQAVLADKIVVEDKLKKITKLESQIESTVSKYRKDISFFQHNDDCPTCRQTIAIGFKETEIANLSTKSTECEHGLKELDSKLQGLQKSLGEINDVQKIVQQLQIKIATNNNAITETNKQIDRLNVKIAELKSPKDTTDAEELALASLKQKLNDLKNRLRVLLDEKSYYDAASILLKDTGIKTKIIKQYLPVINKLVNKYLASMDFFVNFTLDENFKETIKSRHRDDFTYESFSEGEKQRIDMALMLTWRAVAKLKNSANTNLLILDEIFDSSLDTNGTDDLMKILHLLEGVNLFVISHKGDILQDKFRNIIKFEKVKNFSRIAK
jgi:DNA repair exonuclease SbcCD ATPase subunit